MGFFNKKKDDFNSSDGKKIGIGAASGASAGALIGLAVGGPLGSLIGAAIGGAGGAGAAGALDSNNTDKPWKKK